MMSDMGSEPKSKRFIESWMGKLALILLGAVWIFSMSGVDSNAYSALPVTIGVGIVALLIVSGVCSGYKLVRMSMLGWISLVGVGGYFLARCCMSYSIVEAWREGALILGCMVFYLMGVYAAQLKSSGWFYGVILVAVVLNILYAYLMNYTETPMIYTGRPEIGLSGVNTRPSSLFMYSNVGGAFLMIGGFLLLNMAMWALRARFLYALIGIISVVLSFYYEADVVYVLFPLLLVGFILVQFAVRLYEGKRIGWAGVLCGIAVIVAAGVGVCELVLGHELFSQTMSVDTSGRDYVWDKALIVAFRAPLWGYGASAAQWEILPIYTFLVSSPNFLHNEYLQAWVDYGILGLMFVVGVIVLHAGVGLWAVASNHIEQEKRKRKLLAFIAVAALAVCAFSDFFWHFYSIAAMTAFCCGVLAAPYTRERITRPWQRKWVSSSKQSLVPLRAQGMFGSGMMALFCLAMVAYAGWLSVKLYPAWMVQWKFAALCEPGKDEDARERHFLQEQLLDVYPDAIIMEYFYSMPLSGISWQRQELALKKVLSANPKNYFIVSMLGDVLCQQKKHAEAEALYRKHFSHCQLPRAFTAYIVRRWSSYYAYNLLRWGYQRMRLGDEQQAYSMMDYALNMNAVQRIRFDYQCRKDNEVWNQRPGAHPEAKGFIQKCTKYVELFKVLGVQKDESWKMPMEGSVGGPLYQEWGHKQRPEPKKKRKRKARSQNKH